MKNIQYLDEHPVEFTNDDNDNSIVVVPRVLDPSEIEELRLKAEKIKEEQRQQALEAAASQQQQHVVVQSNTQQQSSPQKEEKEKQLYSLTTNAQLSSVTVAAQQAIDSSFNAPMLISFLLRRYTEDPTVLNSLEFILSHLDSGQGCVLFTRHGVVPVLLRIAEHHTRHAKILLYVLQIFKQLLDCNYTRDMVLGELKEKIVDLLFDITYLHMGSIDHVLFGARALMQCTREEVCRTRMMERQVIPYLLIMAKKYMHTYPTLINSVLRICLWFCVSVTNTQYLLEQKAIPYLIKFMKLHLRDRLVLIPAIALLRKFILVIPSTIDTILKHNIVSLVIKALEIIYDNEEIQLEALKFIQIISMTSKGWDQISSMKAAWQKICSGTEKGNVLVHDLPGAFQNPGWVLSETPHLTLLEKLKLTAGENTKTSLDMIIRTNWTSNALREYMGLSMEGQKLAINTEYHDIFFNLLVTLDLLPREEEIRSNWYIRVRTFEKDNDVKVEEMCYTIQEMRRREAIQKKMMAQSQVYVSNETGTEFTAITRKEVYVKGVKIDEKYLQENDMNLNEAFYSQFEKSEMKKDGLLEEDEEEEEGEEQEENEEEEEEEEDYIAS
jgi:hypothetical protein